MKFDVILIRYGELTTKGKNRNKFINFLRENVSIKLKKFPNLKFEPTRDRLYIHLNGEDHNEVMTELEEVFGIHKFNLAMKVATDLEEIKKGVIFAAENETEGKTFKISVHRSYKQFPMETIELQRELGATILIGLDGRLQVDVKKPDINIRVEVRNDFTYIMCQERYGSGGYPVGVSGKAMCLLSGGIDSPVAAYLMMKRGVNIECIHFHSPPFTSERAKEKVEDLAKHLTKYTKRIVLHLVPFTELQKAIHKEVPGAYTMTVMRRMMLRIADQIAEQRNALAIATGESLGQVASQTLDSMYTINEVTNRPVLRPLITMDKLEIIDLANKIGTYNTSIRPYEDCCTVFLPDNPSTKPKREKANAFETKFDFEPYIEEAVANVERVIYKQNPKVDPVEEAMNDLF